LERANAALPNTGAGDLSRERVCLLSPASCADVAAAPGRRLTEREVTSLWGRDRSALRTCEERRAVAVKAAGGI